MLFSGDVIEHKGLKFVVDIERDDFMGAPWEDHDGHGPVSEWKSRDEKRSGERPLVSDRQSSRYYDWQEAIKIAKRDGWGSKKFGWSGNRPLSYYHFLLKHWRKPTRGEIAEAAVQEDFDYLRRWCNDDWEWVWVRVTLLDENGDRDEDRYESVAGLQSDDDKGIETEAHELAEVLWIEEMKRRKRRQEEEARTMEEARPDMYGVSYADQ